MFRSHRCNVRGANPGSESLQPGIRFQTQQERNKSLQGKRGSRTSMSYQTINPFTEKLVKTFTEQTNEQLEAIIAQADNTYRNDWSLHTLEDRKKILKNVVKIFRERRDELAGYITLEMGKLMTESRGEVDLSAEILE